MTNTKEQIRRIIIKQVGYTISDIMNLKGMGLDYLNIIDLEPAKSPEEFIKFMDTIK